MQLNYTLDDAKAALHSKRHCFEVYNSDQIKSRYLLEALVELLPQFPQEKWLEKLKIGGIYLNGKRALQDVLLPFPCKLEYFELRDQSDSWDKVYPEILAENIFYQNQGVVGAFKPAGIPTLAARDQLHLNFRSRMEELLNSKQLHFPSRLDTSVSGLVVFSSNPSIHGKLQRIYQQKMVKKRYLAIVSPVPDWQEIEVDLPISKHPEWGVLRVAGPADGKAATTFIRNLGRISEGIGESDSALVEVFPKTGRTHQIRVHLSTIGYPIVGDRFYGGVKASCLHLHSYSSSFTHPSLGENIVIETPGSLLPEWIKRIARQNPNQIANLAG